MHRFALFALLVGLVCVAQAQPNELPGYFLVHRDYLKPGRQSDFEATRQEYMDWVRRHATPPGESPVHFLVVDEGKQIWALRPAQNWADVAVKSRSNNQVTNLVEKAVGRQLEENDQRMHDSIIRHHNELWAVRGEIRGRAPGSLASAFAQAQWLVAYTPRPSASESDLKPVETALSQVPGWNWELVSYLGSGQRLIMMGSTTTLEDTKVKSLVSALRRIAVEEVEVLRVRSAPALSVSP